MIGINDHAYLEVQASENQKFDFYGDTFKKLYFSAIMC